MVVAVALNERFQIFDLQLLVRDLVVRIGALVRELHQRLAAKHDAVGEPGSQRAGDGVLRLRIDEGVGRIRATDRQLRLIQPCARAHRITLDAESLRLAHRSEAFDDLRQETAAHAEQQLVMPLEEAFCLPVECRKFLERQKTHRGVRVESGPHSPLCGVVKAGAVPFAV
jgi:hypothetical protein